MAAPGTRLTEIEGRSVYMPADQVELTKLIAEGLRLQLERDKLTAQLDDVKERVIELVTKIRAGRSSVLVAALDGAGITQVIWKKGEATVDPEKAKSLENELSAQVFSSIFEKRTKYVLRRGYTRFVQTPQTPDLEAIKKRVAACIDVKSAPAPSVKFLSGEAPVIEDDGE